MAEEKDSQGVHRANRGNEGSPLKAELSLDQWTEDILDLTPLLLLRCVPRRRWDLLRYREALKQRFAAAVDSVPEWVGDEAEQLERGDDVAGDVLSRWVADERLTRDGMPRPLSDEEIDSLIRSVSESANVKEVKESLLSTRSVEFASGYFLHKMRNMELREVPRLMAWHNRRVVWTALRTVEGNARRQEELRRFEFMTVGSVPREMDYSRFRKEIKDPALSCLETVDDIITRSTTSGSDGEKIRVVVAIIQGDDLPLPPLQQPVAPERGNP